VLAHDDFASTRASRQVRPVTFTPSDLRSRPRSPTRRAETLLLAIPSGSRENLPPGVRSSARRRVPDEPTRSVPPPRVREEAGPVERRLRQEDASSRRRSVSPGKPTMNADRSDASGNLSGCDRSVEELLGVAHRRILATSFPGRVLQRKGRSTERRGRITHSRHTGPRSRSGGYGRASGATTVLRCRRAAEQRRQFPLRVRSRRRATCLVRRGHFFHALRREPGDLEIDASAGESGSASDHGIAQKLHTIATFGIHERRRTGRLGLNSMPVHCRVETDWRDPRSWLR